MTQSNKKDKRDTFTQHKECTIYLCTKCGADEIGSLNLVALKRDPQPQSEALDIVIIGI